ncbi:MAG: dihydroorotase [Planctomycetota bacterium]|nr:MAG: dihydroorotase [Planctomycetota bacterium]
MKTLIKNAQVVFPEEVCKSNVLVVGTTIAAVDAAVQTRADETVDAAGLHLLPGVIDDQVHFREPGLTHKEDLFTASRACAKGGVTTFLEMPNTAPATTTQQLLDAKRALAAEKSLVNYGFYIGATPHNLDELRTARNTPGIKIFIGSSTGDLLVDDQPTLERIFAETSLPIAAHCEDEATVRANAARFQGVADVAVHSQIRDVAAAVTATRRAVDLALRHKHRFHVLHVSTGDEADLLRDCLSSASAGASAAAAVAARPWITAEACPHHLLLNVDDYARLGSLVQMNPSLKTADDNRRLWQALLDNSIQVVATDHAPHTLEEKARPYPNSPSGMPNVENSLALMLNEANRQRCTLLQVVHWMSEAPARVWDIVDKGRIAAGYDADLVLVDMQLVQTVRHDEQLTKCRWSAWHGAELAGWPVRTWVRGQEVFRHGRVSDSVRGGEAQFDHARGGYWATAGCW